MTKYSTLQRELVDLIRTQLRPHDLLPSERELMQRYGVSRMTVRSAIGGLVEDAMVYRVRGSGTYVGEAATVSQPLRLLSFTEDMRERALRPGARPLSGEEVPAAHPVTRDLALPPGRPVVRLRRLRLADGAPMALETVHLSAALVPGLLSHDLTGSLYELLRMEFGLTLQRAVQRIEAAALTPAEARLLAAPPRSPALRIQRLGVDQRGKPITLSTTVYRADRYALTLTVRRDRHP